MFRNALFCIVLFGLFSCAGNNFIPDHSNRIQNQYVDERSEPGHRQPPSEQEEILKLTTKKEIHLEDLLRIASLYNPEINAAKNSFWAAEGRVHQTGLYPNPTIAFELEDVPEDDIDLSHSENTVSITQPILVGKQRSTAVLEASAKRDGLGFSLASKLRETLSDVHLVYIELLYLKMAQTLHEDLIATTKKSYEIARTRFDARAVSEIEVFKTQIKVRELEMGQNRLSFQLSSTSQRLKSLLSGIPITVDRIKGDLLSDFPQLDLKHLTSNLQESHPGILAAKKEAEAAEKHIERVKAERMSLVNVHGSYGRNSAENKNIFSAGISMPLPIFNRNQGKILEAQHLANRAREDAKAYTHHLTAELASLHALYMSSKNDFTVYRDHIEPDATQAFYQSMEAYQAGRMQLSDLLETQEALVQARIKLLETVRDLNIAYVRLCRLVGLII